MKVLTQIHQILATPSSNQLDALYALIEDHMSNVFVNCDIEHLEDTVCQFFSVESDSLYERTLGGGKSYANLAPSIMYYLLYHYKGFKQEDIAERYQKSQQAVSLGIKRIEGMLEVSDCPELQLIQSLLRNAA